MLPSAASKGRVPIRSKNRDRPLWIFTPALRQSILTMDDIFDVRTHAPGPPGRLPLQPDLLRDAPSGYVFGWTQDAAMGWSPSDLGKDEYLILSTQGGIRADDGVPIALGYHTGHYEVGLLAQAAAR